MSYPPSIPPGPLPNPGLDYATLKQEGFALTQQWSGAIWTDYNEHDPGVTTLEQLCYALTELSYRAEFPIADLLADPECGEIDADALALYPPAEALTVNPVTVDDYRKLVLDRIPQLANAWFEPVCPDDAHGINGRYDVVLFPRWLAADTAPGEAGEDAPDDCDDDGDPDHHHHHHHHHRHHHHPLRDEVQSVYRAHRNLCEDIRHIRTLRGLDVVVRGEVSIGAARDPADILAGIYFALAQLFAPEPKRHSLRAALDAGEEPASILTGPLLREGLVGEGELQPRQREFTKAEIAAAILNVPGVIGLGDLSFRIEGERHRPDAGHDWIVVPDDAILIARPGRPSEDGQYPIRLTRDGVPVPPGPAMRSRLRALEQEQAQRYHLGVEYAHLLGFPEGRYRDLEPYFSIQNQYPNVYGIGEEGPPADADSARLAQGRQLKGYLLPFEQLLTDFLAQLAHIRDLFAIAPRELRTYFFQSLRKSVPDVGPLLGRGYREGLARIVASQDDAVERRNRFLNLTMALYAERLDLTALADILGIGHAGALQMSGRQELLRNFLPLSRRRGAAGDRAARDPARNVPGMLIKSRIELGIPPLGRRHGHHRDHDHHDHHHHHHHHHHHDAALYIVEDVRLWMGQRTRHRRNPSMTITAVFYPGENVRDRAAYIDLARQVVRRNTPAHIAVRFCHLGASEHEDFAPLHARWCETNDAGDASAFAEAADGLARMLDKA